MKKILLLLAISGALFMVSCTKQYTQVVPNQTVYANLTPTDWTTADTGKNYTTTITPPSGSTFDLNAGLIIYFTFDGGTTYEQIPEVYNNVSFTYTYTAGIIKLYAQSSTGTTPITAPSALTAKIVLVASE